MQGVGLPQRSRPRGRQASGEQRALGEPDPPTVRDPLQALPTAIWFPSRLSSGENMLHIASAQVRLATPDVSSVASRLERLKSRRRRLQIEAGAVRLSVRPIRSQQRLPMCLAFFPSYAMHQ
jgi:hypothetical protein